MRRIGEGLGSLRVRPTRRTDLPHSPRGCTAPSRWGTHPGAVDPERGVCGQQDAGAPRTLSNPQGGPRTCSSAWSSPAGEGPTVTSPEPWDDDNPFPDPDPFATCEEPDSAGTGNTPLQKDRDA